MTLFYRQYNSVRDVTQWAQGRPEDVLWTSILDEGTSQSDVQGTKENNDTLLSIIQVYVTLKQ